MSDLVTGLRDALHDFVAPELKAQAVKLKALQKPGEFPRGAMMKTLDSPRAEMRAEFAALRANNQVEVFRQVSPMRERIAVVESRTKNG